MTSHTISPGKFVKKLNEGGTSVDCKPVDVIPHLGPAPKLPPARPGADRAEEPGFLKKTGAGATANNPSITGVIGFPGALALLSECGQL